MNGVVLIATRGGIFLSISCLSGELKQEHASAGVNRQPAVPPTTCYVGERLEHSCLWRDFCILSTWGDRSIAFDMCRCHLKLWRAMYG